MSKFLSGVDIGRVIISAALTVGAFCIVPTIANGCSRDEILEYLGVHPPVQPTPPCATAASGIECPVTFEHCFPSMLEELITLVAIVAACLIAGALAGRGATTNPVRGAITVGLAAGIAVVIESYRFRMIPIPASLVLVSVSALLGLAGGYAAKRNTA